MKKLLLLLVFAFMAVLPMSASTADDVTYIRKFYTEYKSASEYDHGLNYYSCEKRYPVIQKYCSETFFKTMKNDVMGYDFPTDDFGIDDLSLTTFKIVSIGNSIYNVTFQTHFINPLGKKAIQMVKVKITMQNGKINYIEGLSE